jgi:HD-GYP domain-containing protein (c-di-GMP phosphodiesterase class II)
MHKKSTRYIQIDKNIITEGMVCPFSIFTSSDSNAQMHCFKELGELITSDESVIIDTDKLLYVLEAEHPKYEYLRASLLDSKDSQKIKNVNFAEQSLSIYKNASDVLTNLFNDPETLGNYEASKLIVNDIVETILNDKYTIQSLMSIASHDYYTHTHSINVSIYALSLGSFLNFTQKELSELGEAALLHDLGKSKIAPEIINKNGKLTDAEFQKIKEHPAHGYTIGLKLGIKNRKVLEGIRHHHEKIDGTGYPFGLRGEAIPYYARIIGLCDVFDALTSRRSYKEPMTSFEALSLIKINMKNHIDSTLLKKMIEMFR